MKKRRRWLAFVACFLLVPLILLTALILMENEVGRSFRAALRYVLENELIEVDEWPQSRTFDALYVLGGNPGAQRYKFNVVAKIYDQKICRKIYMMSVEGMMGYNVDLARSQTVDEWSFSKMKRLGIPSSDVKALSMERGLLGTMKEAKNVAGILSEGKFKNIVLVAAPYHSKRVRVTFEYFLKGTGVDVVVLGSGEPKYLRSLAMEWAKLKMYEVLLLVG